MPLSPNIKSPAATGLSIIFPPKWRKARCLNYLLDREYIHGDLCLNYFASKAGFTVEWICLNPTAPPMKGWALMWVFNQMENEGLNQPPTEQN